jgi:hypothetical protein
MRKEIPKEKIVHYGGIYTEWSHQNTIKKAVENTVRIHTEKTTSDNNTYKSVSKAKADIDNKLSPVGGNNTIPVSVLPVLISDNQNRAIKHKIRKDIHSKFVASTTDHEILCIIKPYMRSKTLPRMDIESSHRMVLDRIRKGDITTADNCVYNKHLNPYLFQNGSYNDHSPCHICQRIGMIFDTFCITYREHHEHIPLCVSCGASIEAKGNVLFDKIGKLKYDNFIKNVMYICHNLPQDVIYIITQYVYMMLDNVCIKY